MDDCSSASLAAGGHYECMTIGASLFLIALGAILKYAVNATVAGVEIQTVGVILMVAGAVGLVIGLFLIASGRRRVDPADQRVVYEERRDPLV